MSSTTVTRRNEWLVLILFLFICFAVAGISSVATNSEIDSWYAGINKPEWTPPNWLFGPMWTTLYALMAVAAWLVWRRAGWREGRAALVMFFVQLALNFAWSFIFFGGHLIAAAAIEIAILWVAIAATIALFWRHSRLAALLLLPYLAWVGFATALNFAIWRLNE